MAELYGLNADNEIDDVAQKILLEIRLRILVD